VGSQVESEKNISIFMTLASETAAWKKTKYL